MRCRLLHWAGAIGVALLTASCASPPAGPAMQAAAALATRAAAPGAVAVTVIGGQETSALDGPNIGDAAFKAAVEASLLQARAFEPGVEGVAPARYALGATIVRLAKPLFGGTFTVELEVGWTLLDRSRGQVLLRKSITSTGSAGMSDALVGATRLRLAVEAAARANIEHLLRELATLPY